MKQTLRLQVIFILAILQLTFALAKVELVSAIPARGSVVQVLPSEIQLTMSEAVDMQLSRFRVYGFQITHDAKPRQVARAFFAGNFLDLPITGFTEAETSLSYKTNSNIVIDLKEDLPAGTYVVTWQTYSHEFKFQKGFTFFVYSPERATGHEEEHMEHHETTMEHDDHKEMKHEEHHDMVEPEPYYHEGEEFQDDHGEDMEVQEHGHGDEHKEMKHEEEHHDMMGPEHHDKDYKHKDGHGDEHKEMKHEEEHHDMMGPEHHDEGYGHKDDHGEAMEAQEHGHSEMQGHDDGHHEMKHKEEHHDMMEPEHHDEGYGHKDDHGEAMEAQEHGHGDEHKEMKHVEPDHHSAKENKHEEAHDHSHDQSDSQGHIEMGCNRCKCFSNRGEG